MLIMTEMTQSRQCELLEHDMTAEHVKCFKEEDLYLTTAEYLKKNVNDDNKKEIISDMKDFLSSCERNNTERLPCKENNTNSQSLLKQTCQFRDKAKVAKDKESASLVPERNLQKLHQILIDPIKDPRIIPTDPITSEHNSTTNGWYKETIWIIQNSLAMSIPYFSTSSFQIISKSGNICEMRVVDRVVHTKCNSSRTLTSSWRLCALRIRFFFDSSNEIQNRKVLYPNKIINMNKSIDPKLPHKS